MRLADLDELAAHRKPHRPKPDKRERRARRAAREAATEAEQREYARQCILYVARCSGLEA